MLSEVFNVVKEHPNCLCRHLERPNERGSVAALKVKDSNFVVVEGSYESTENRLLNRPNSIGHAPFSDES